MKTIGIVTLYDNINIGNKLQNYAVQCFFEDMGYKCETIPHWEMAHKKIGTKYIKQKIIRIIGLPKDSAKRLKAENRRKSLFKAFSDKYIKLGKEVKFNKIPDDLASRYDYFVVGSDQVWHNWTNTYNEISYFMLEFAERSQRITIAPSFGKSYIESELKERYISGLNGFEVITCREQDGARIVNELTGKKAHVILDPTMLIDSNRWVKMAKKPNMNIPENYILVYALGSMSMERENWIDKLSKKYQLKVVNIMNSQSHEYYQTTPDEFLYLIKHAKLIITDSFHASVFSILFKRDFIVLDRITESMGDMSSRLDTLLQSFNLENRKYGIDIESVFSTDFSNVDKVLIEERIRVKQLYKDTFNALNAMKE